MGEVAKNYQQILAAVHAAYPSSQGLGCPDIPDNCFRDGCYSPTHVTEKELIDRVVEGAKPENFHCGVLVANARIVQSLLGLRTNQVILEPTSLTQAASTPNPSPQTG